MAKNHSLFRLNPGASLEKTRRSNADFSKLEPGLPTAARNGWSSAALTHVRWDGFHRDPKLRMGISQPVTGPRLDEIEEFFRVRGAEIFHEVCPLADPSAVALLNERGYQPMEFTSVMYRPILKDLRLGASRNEQIQVRLIHPGEEERWAQTAARGWSETSELEDFFKG